MAQSREFLYIVQESAYKTPVASPVVGTSAWYLRLDGGNAFKGRPKPIQVGIPYGGGFNVRAATLSDKLETKWQLSTILYGSQIVPLLGWAGLRINAGQTSPWTTTEPAGDLASMAIYHGITRGDGSVKRRVYLGSKVDEWGLEVGEDGQFCRLNLSGTSSTPQSNQFDSSTDPTAVTFPVPTDAQLPTDAMLFIHTGGFISIGGSTRAACSRFKFSSKNVMKGKYFNNRFLQLYHLYGRESTFEADLEYLPTPDDRTIYEGSTSEGASFEISNGTHSATITLNNQNVKTGLEDDLPLDDLFYQKATGLNQWDATAGADFTLALT